MTFLLFFYIYLKIVIIKAGCQQFFETKLLASDKNTHKMNKFSKTNEKEVFQKFSIK